MRSKILTFKKGFTQPVFEKLAGFTLVETLVAISILLIVIIGPMTIAQKGIQNAYFAREQVTAVFLAQEAIEAVRELRDADALDAYSVASGDDTWSWYGFLPSDCKGLYDDADGCAYDVTANEFKNCSDPDVNECKLRVTDGNYNYEPGTESPFTRKVYIEASPTDDWVLVKVDVFWDTKIFGATEKHVILQTWIYDHYQRYEY